MAELSRRGDGRDGRWIVVRRRFTAPWQVVFRHWITPHELARWFGPVGFEVSEFALEPVVGGAYRLTLRAPSGEERAVSGRFLLIDPPARLRFSWHPEGWPEANQVELALTADRGATDLALRHGPFRDPAIARTHRLGWRSTLESLALDLAELEAE